MEKYTDCYVIYHKILDYGVWNNEVWEPLQVNVEKNGRITEYGGRYDNEGENVSQWNNTLGELTGVWWIWHNLTGKKYAGQVQYRRRFDIQTIEELDKAFESHEVITMVPKNLGTTLRKQYAACHSPKDLDLCEKIVKRLYPEYADDWDKYINSGTEIYYSNGFIFKSEDYCKYCEWLFSILFEFAAEMRWNTPEDIRDYVDKEIKSGARRNIDNRGKADNALNYQQQILVFMSERLFTLYLNHNYKKSDILTLEYRRMEPCY